MNHSFIDLLRIQSSPSLRMVDDADNVFPSMNQGAGSQLTLSKAIETVTVMRSPVSALAGFGLTLTETSDTETPSA
jgi:hypothetical protein